MKCQEQQDEMIVERPGCPERRVFLVTQAVARGLGKS